MRIPETGPKAQTDDADDRTRLALLWRAFEEAEERIRELERDADERGTLAKANAETMQLRREVASAKALLAADEDRYQHAQHVIRHLEQKREAAQRDADLFRSRAQIANGTIADERAKASVLQERIAAAEREVVRLTATNAALVEFRQELEARALAATEAASRDEHARRWHPPARLYPLSDARVAEIPTVTEDEAAALRNAGINMADALLYADIGALAEVAGIGAPRLWKIRALAELMSVRGVGPEAAERLFRAGVRSIDDITTRTASELEAILGKPGDQVLEHAIEATIV